MSLCLLGLEILAVSGIVLTSWSLLTLLLNWLLTATLVSIVLGFCAEVRGSQRTALSRPLPPMHNMLLQYYSQNGNLMTMTNSGRHGEEGERGKLLVFGGPNWFIILVWVPPQTD